MVSLLLTCICWHLELRAEKQNRTSYPDSKDRHRLDIDPTLSHRIHPHSPQFVVFSSS